MKTALTVKAGGKDYPVEIGDEDGKFSIQVDTPGEGHGYHYVTATSFAELERKARKIKVKFEMAFSRVESRRVRHGKVTGLHATSGNVLVKWDDGETEQLPSWSGGGDVMPRLTDDETAELTRLIQARNAVNRDLELFTGPRKFTSLKKAAEEAQARAVAADA